jgi:4-diphosphocytidyl-2-C-methyl-D-erythritol kinase
MVSFPSCKINLGLNVLRKRYDGYHDIDTCFFSVPYTDILEVIPSNEFSLTLSGRTIPGKEEENICVKAYRLMEEKFSLSPVNIHLHKNVPAGAGLGGGSADGAYTLRMLNEVFDLGLSKSDLAHYASALGSDCSFFVYDSPMLGKGRGELLTPVSLSLKGFYLILVNPGIHVSTAEAYSGIIPAAPAISISDIISRPVTEWRGELKNDFEESVFKKYPDIKNIKNEFYASGAVYASMSGSGSSVYGIFTNETDVSDKIMNRVLWRGYLS